MSSVYTALSVMQIFLLATEPGSEMRDFNLLCPWSKIISRTFCWPAEKRDAVKAVEFIIGVIVASIIQVY